MSQMMQMYQQVGPAQFSAMIGQFAPYFASIAPQFVELRPGYAEVTFPKRREVLNHIGTVHAIALCNAAELAAGTMTDASIPAGHRWIPRGMTVEYLAKATGDVRAVADGSQIDWQATGNLVVPVVAYVDDKPVFRAEITMYVGQPYSRSREQTTETGMNPPQPRLIDNGNGHPLASHWYRPAGEPRGYLLIVPAMGVEQRFYAPFAAWLAERGYLAITFDYLGMGQSRNGSLRGLEVDVLGWARHDCSAMLAAALAESGSKPLYWIGHSLGGQILPFVEGRERIERVFSIASGSGYWKENSPRLRNKVWLFWYLVAPLLTPLLGYFPGRRLGMVGDLPRGVIEQWRRWCLHPQYALADGEAIRRAFSAVRTPIVSLSFTDDEMMSRRSIESLLGFYREAPKTAWRIAPEEIGARHIGHFGFFRPQFAESLWAGYLLPELGSGNALSRG